MTEFQANEFRTYEVTVEGVNFGFINTANGGYSSTLGELFQYDGTTVILEDGREFTDVPQLRSAIRSGWCTLVGEAKPLRRPKSAGIEVRATTQVGNERVVKVVPQMERAEEDVVVVVDERRRRRETTNEDAARRVPLETPAGRRALASQWSSGDDEVDEIAAAMTDEMDEWLLAQEEEEAPLDEDPHDPLKARAEADILSLFALLDEEDPRSESRVRRAAKKAAKAPAVSRPRTSASSTSALRNLPVDVPEGERKAMPIVREEDTVENSGAIVGKVEREQERSIDVVPARPAQASRPSPRFGGAGAIVVDEQRHMGDIALSDTGRAPIRMDETAAVRPSSTESIKVGDVQVGDRRKVARAAVETDQGIAVGRILSPTHRGFVADATNTSPDAIQRAQEGHHVRIEKFEVEDDGKGKSRAVATGDVQETMVGDELEELLPDAAQGPKPVVHRRPEEDPAYAAVKALIPNFEWNKDRPVKERVAEALKHYKDPQYLKGILAVETEVAKEAIKKALAELLAKKKKAAKKAQKAG